MKTNTLYAGDCLDRMREWPDACVDLIYLDPPFNSKANYNILFGRGKDKNKKNDLAQMTAFTDTWQWDADAERRVHHMRKAIDHPAHYAMKAFDMLFHGGNGMLAYLSYMAERLAEMHRVLKDTGSIYLHCDPTASHYLKVVMDEIFGKKNYRNEIVWCYSGGGIPKNDFPRKHDVLLHYSKSNVYTFHREFIPYGEHYQKGGTKRFTSHDGKRSREYRAEGTPVRSWWPDIKPLLNLHKENINYPTQKPLALLNRIIKTSSNENDVVLDPFCGCGTTIEAAHLLKRHWVGVDISYYAIQVIRRERMKDMRIVVDGEPTSHQAAVYFSDKHPFEFEKWAVTRVHGFAPNTVQRGDGGIDGRALIWNGEQDNDLCIAQVKRGKPSVDALRAFYGKIAAGEAAIGLFITLYKQKRTPTARELTAKAGYIDIGGKQFNRLVMWSIEEFFEGQEPKIPHLAHPRTGAPLQEQVFELQGG
ncbi:MAG: DNA methyltransferase [Gammaproteobacteria bacterium]|nr:DNA methyltransferase [Gammaproteobacteria bacterium]